MADENRIYGRTTAFTDTGPISHHNEMEAHREVATKQLGGHVHYVASTTTQFETFGDSGEKIGDQTIMTTKWRLAPPDPAPEAPASE